MERVIVHNEDVISRLSKRINDSMYNSVDNSLIKYNELPQEDLYLSQVSDYINGKFKSDNFTLSVIQNYVKNEVISKPQDGKKRGYTKLHIIQLIFVGYMRPVLNTEEIKSVFRLVFNDINNMDDNILSWDDAYKLFEELQRRNACKNYITIDIEQDDIIHKYLSGYKFTEEEKERIFSFLIIINLIAQAGEIKTLINRMVKTYN